MISKSLLLVALLNLCFLLPLPKLAAGGSSAGLTEFDLKVKEMATQCRREVIAEFERVLTSKMLTLNQLFDTFYIPIPNTQPQKYHTVYDQVMDVKLRRIFDRYLETDRRIVFVVAVDRNGYLPTHNSKFSKPLTDDPIYNAIHNRTKRLFNDRTGLAAARNLMPFLVQRYHRDTGEELFDLSVPLKFRTKHWGAIRIGYMRK